VNVLYLLSEWPTPTNAGARVHDKLMLKCLTEQFGADVAYWSYRAGPDSYERAKSLKIMPFHDYRSWDLPLTLARLLVKGEPLPTSQFLSVAARRELRDLVERTRPDVIVLSCVELAVTLPLLRELSSAKLVVDIHDLQGLRYESILRACKPWQVSKRVKHELLMRSCNIIEHEHYRFADVAWALKQEDADILLTFGSVSEVHVVPNVVDPEGLPQQLNFDDPSSGLPVTAVYLGNYSGAPNEQCALRLLQLFSQPAIRDSGLKLNLIGMHPTSAMRRAAAALPNVTIHGTVDRLADYLIPIDAIFVAPLDAGGGVKRKVLEGMMHGCPMLTTEIGAEGLELSHGKNALVVPADEMEGPLLKLITDRSERHRIAKSGYAHVMRRFGYGRLLDAVTESMRKLAK